MRLLAVLFLILATVFGQQNAGIYIRLNQNAVDYITGLASEALPQLLGRLSPPKITKHISGAQVDVYQTLIHEVTKPNITAKFVEGKGIRAGIHLPFLRVSTKAEINAFVFFSAEGAVMVDVHNLTMNLEIHYLRNETSERNIIEVPHCSVNHSELNLVLDKDSQLNAFRTEFETGIVDGLRVTICDTLREALQFVDDQDVQAAVTSYEPEPEDPNDFDPAELGLSLCSDKESDPSPSEASSSNQSWSADLTLVYPPRFTKDDLVFGIDGGITVNGQKAVDVDPAADFNITAFEEQMISIAVLDYVPNTILSHIYDNDLGKFNERFTSENLPKSMQKLGRMICEKCYLDVTARLTERPRVEIDDKLGARVLLTANVTVQFQGRQNLHDLIHAAATMHITLKPTIRHSRVYGDVSLTSVDVNVFKMAVTGAFASPLEKTVSFIVPKVLWPQVKKRLRFALNRRGIQLPVICGVELDHLNMYYTDRAIILNSDFQFDLPMFITKFKRYLQLKADSNPDLPRYMH